jgi:tRNA(Ile)-lysidine synthase
LAASLFLYSLHLISLEVSQARPGNFHAMMQAKRGHPLQRTSFAEQLERRLAEGLKERAWFRAGLKIGAAVSGGADSVALVTLLAELRSNLGIVVSAVHFNHRLRGKTSDRDEEFVARLAEKFGVTLHVGRADVAGKAKREKANLEDAARRARYAFFERLAGQGVVNIVATAHTTDDQAETVLAHILRGTGIAGLAGIHPVAGKVARPLLGFRRAELRGYLRAKKQTWREDATNRDITRTRARMRKKLLPLLEKEFNPAAIEHLAALADRAREQASFVGHLAEQLFLKHVLLDQNTARIGLAELLNPLGLRELDAGQVLPARLTQQIIERVRQARGQISAAHIQAILTLAKTGDPGKRLQIPGGIDVARDRDALIFQPRQK